MKKVCLNEIQQHLLSEENILWTGKSDDNKIFTIKDILWIPLTCTFLFGALVVELSGIIMLFDPEGSLQKDSSRGLGLVLSLLGIILIMFMYYLTIGRFVVKKSYKKYTNYVVTNKRVIVLSNYCKRKKIIEEYIDKITDVHILVNGSGNGTLKFGEINSPNKMLASSSLLEHLMFPIEEIPIFYDIDDAEKVYELVNNLKTM